jgi:hypothetical protein
LSAGSRKAEREAWAAQHSAGPIPRFARQEGRIYARKLPAQSVAGCTPENGGRMKLFPASSTQINRLLADWGRGNPEAREELMPVVYGELRRLAKVHRAGRAALNTGPG